MSQTAIAFIEESLSDTPHLQPITTTGAHFQWLAPGVLRIDPLQAGVLPAAIITVAVHGNETVPIRLVDQWLDGLVAQQTQVLRPMLVILANPASVLIGERFVEHNMNRLFSSKSVNDPAPECQRAVVLMEHVRQFIAQHPQGMHFDMHSTIKGSDQDRFAIIPDACKGRDLTDLLSWFKHFAVDAWVQNISPAATFSSFTANLGYQSATLELGQVRALDEPIDRFLPLLKELERLAKGPHEACAHQPVAYQVVGEILRPEGEFKVHLHDFVNFRALPKDTLIAAGEQQTWRVEQEGDALLFLNATVPVGHRVALLIRADRT